MMLQKKKEQYYVLQLKRKMNYGKELWHTVNSIMGKHLHNLL